MIDPDEPSGISGHWVHQNHDNLISATKQCKGEKKMNKTIVGKRKVGYTSKKTGQLVTGVELHCVGNSQRTDFEGMECETIFISSNSSVYSQCLGVPIGAEIAVSYDRRGFLESLVLVESKEKK